MQKWKPLCKNYTQYILSRRTLFTQTSTQTKPYEVLTEPYRLSQTNNVPDHIKRPPYVASMETSTFLSILKGSMTPSKSIIKSDDVIKRVRYASKIGRRVLNTVGEIIKPGLSTSQLDYVSHQLICNHNGYPSPLSYKGFPKSICTSVNNVVVHGIPDRRCLVSGDIVNVDVTVYINGVHGDLSETFLIGQVDEKGKHLVDVTRKCLYLAISKCRPGAKFKEIGTVISNYAGKHGFSVCPYFVGHGIGENFHEEPQVLHHYNDNEQVMKPGMIFTIEPVICEGRSEIELWNDGWTAVTADQMRAAQFEHTILITSDGVEVLTEKNTCDLHTKPSMDDINIAENFLNHDNN